MSAIDIEIEGETCQPAQFRNAGFVSVCEYVTNLSEICDGDGYIPWTQFKFCTNSEVLEILVVILAVYFFFYCFVMFTTTVEHFFSPNIVTIVHHHKIPQDIAGVTLMAFGNGAPDVFSAIASVASVKHPDSGMALSVLMGGDFFVVTIVLASVILVNPCRVMRRPAIRDCLFYLATSVMILVVLTTSTELQTWQPAMFLLLYAIYAFVVVCGGSIRRRLNKGRSSFSFIDRSMSILSEILPRKVTLADGKQIPQMFECNIERISTNETSVDLSRSNSTESNEQPGYRQPPVTKEIPVFTLNSDNLAIADDVIKNSDTAPSLLNIPVQNLDTISFNSEIMHYQEDRHITKNFIENATLSHARPHTESAKEQVVEMFRRICPLDMAKFRASNAFNKCRQLVEIPCMSILNLSVPKATGPWNKPLAMLQAFNAPLILCFAFQPPNYDPFECGPLLWMYAMGISTVVCLTIFIFTSCKRTPKYYKPLCAYAGFVMSVTWIYLTSDEVINLVIMFGNVFGMSYHVLFLTFVAWANSFGDLIADCMLAKHGFAKMAFSATFGSALFSSLIGFGAAFTVAKFQGKRIRVSFDGVKAVMLAALMTTVSTTLILLFVQKFRLHRFHGFCLIGMYIAFLSLALLVNQGIIPSF
ncbi:sodium/calcium exchanger protein domain-containing protein [Ditylenchus destructor]|uniref:Sodium/calcium exchanger protein domain-containing protein n=1 Tax=Ditylenchus destructor TaxID=166010 RepID=A0AAD4MSI2_9BILA|nr:sodium/calcium exchanger protein domain-containing protein [Ditylenchus destructor]